MVGDDAAGGDAMTRVRVDLGHLAAVVVLVVLCSVCYARVGADRLFRDVRPVVCMTDADCSSCQADGAGICAVTP